MIDLDEPVKDYETFLRDEHARNVSDYFEDLLKQSGVDEHLNIETVNELQNLETKVSEEKSKRTMWLVLRVVVIVLIAGGLIEGFVGVGWWHLLILPAIGLGVLLFMKINPRLKFLKNELAELGQKRDAKSNEAWAQMEPLNALYTWHIESDLFQKSFPNVTLDRFFSISRHHDLAETYGLAPNFTDGRSMLFAQSGALKNNPFVITKYVHHWIGSKTYTGTLMIYWTETIRTANGGYQVVQRSQMLTASVVKPFPEYISQASVIYGHEAVPNLSFSRNPSNLSGLEDGLVNNWRKNRAVKKVERHARRDVKSGSGDFTVMSNKEFEALFNAADRDQEIEFRLMFTPLAQQEMVNLLNDHAAGYGDNFAFIKHGNINVVESGHLGSVDFLPNPSIFRTFSVAKAREFFNNFQNNYFRAVYFGLAPFLTVPLYREARSIPMNTHSSDISPWECEAIANLIGHQSFAHPNSVTHNLLRVSGMRNSGNSSSVSVTAYGYEGVPRVDLIPVLGGDGKVHAVPVNWVEYFEVSRTSTMLVGSVGSHNEAKKDAQNDPKNDAKDDQADLMNGWESYLKQHGISTENAVVRGSISAALLGD